MEKCGKGGKNIFFPFFIFVYLKQTQMIPICKLSFRFLEKWIHESRKSENIFKVGKYEKIRGKGIWKTLNFLLMLVMRFLTNKQVIKASSWYLTQTFGGKALKNMGKCWKRGKKYFFPYFFFILLKTNTNDAHMQNNIQILRKMNPWIQKIWKNYQSG